METWAEGWQEQLNIGVANVVAHVKRIEEIKISRRWFSIIAKDEDITDSRLKDLLENIDA